MINDGKYSKNGFIGATSGSSTPNASSILNQYPIKSIINYNSEMNNSISRAKMNSNSTASSCSTNVKFSGLIFKEKIDDREKYLTAKYPNHQMALIKKRLKVEFWIDEQLKFLFDISDDDTKDDYDICADDLVDSLLDMDTDKEREYHILKQLTKVKKCKEEVYKFVNELLAKLRML